MRFCGTEGYNIWTLKWVFVLLTFVDNKNCRKWLLLLFCLSFPFSILYKSISTPLIDLYSFFALEYIITQVTWISWSLLCLFLCTQRDTLSPPIVYIHTYTPVLSQTSWYAHLKLSALSQTCHIHTLQIFILLRQNFRLNRGSNLRTVCLCVLAVHLEVATCFQQVYSCEVKRDNYFSRRNKMRHKRNWKQWDRIRWKNVACEIKIAAVRQWEINKAGGGQQKLENVLKDEKRGWEKKESKKENKKKRIIKNMEHRRNGEEEKKETEEGCSVREREASDVKWNGTEPVVTLFVFVWKA